MTSEKGFAIMGDPGSSASTSDHTVSPGSREEMREKGRVFVAGEALLISIDLSDLSDAAMGALRTKMENRLPRFRLAALVKYRFGFRYMLDGISLVDKKIDVRICATPLSVASRPSLVWDLSTDSIRRGESSDAWVFKADAAAEEMRRWVKRTLKRHDDAIRARLTSNWVPGKGVELSPRSGNALEVEARNEIDLLRRRYAAIHTRMPLALLAAATASLFAAIAWMRPLFDDSRVGQWTIAVPLTMGAILLWIAPFPLLLGARRLQQEMQSKESALDLVSLLNDDEKRAFRLFQIDNLEVGRYYEQALRQRRLIFYVGILCIIVGFASVFAAFRLVASGSQEQLSEKIVVASLGTIGGILANFVGLIFLRMFSSVVQSMVDFHKRLVATHHVVFGNLLVAKIQDAEMRNSTLSKIAQALSRVATNDDSDKSNEPPSAPL